MSDRKRTITSPSYDPGDIGDDDEEEEDSVGGGSSGPPEDDNDYDDLIGGGSSGRTTPDDDDPRLGGGSSDSSSGGSSDRKRTITSPSYDPGDIGDDDEEEEDSVGGGSSGRTTPDEDDPRLPESDSSGNQSQESESNIVEDQTVRTRSDEFTADEIADMARDPEPKLDLESQEEEVAALRQAAENLDEKTETDVGISDVQLDPQSGSAELTPEARDQERRADIRSRENEIEQRAEEDIARAQTQDASRLLGVSDPALREGIQEETEVELEERKEGEFSLNVEESAFEATASTRTQTDPVARADARRRQSSGPLSDIDSVRASPSDAGALISAIGAVPGRLPGEGGSEEDGGVSFNAPVFEREATVGPAPAERERTGTRRVSLPERGFVRRAIDDTTINAPVFEREATVGPGPAERERTGTTEIDIDLPEAGFIQESVDETTINTPEFEREATVGPGPAERERTGTNSYEINLPEEGFIRESIDDRQINAPRFERTGTRGPAPAERERVGTDTREVNLPEEGFVRESVDNETVNVPEFERDATVGPAPGERRQRGSQNVTTDLPERGFVSRTVDGLQFDLPEFEREATVGPAPAEREQTGNQTVDVNLPRRETVAGAALVGVGTPEPLSSAGGGAVLGGLAVGAIVADTVRRSELVQPDEEEDSGELDPGEPVQEQDELEPGEPVQNQREIEVDEEETTVAPEELGIPREAIEEGDATIRGPDGVDITDDGEIVIPLGTTKATGQMLRFEDEEEEEDEDEEEEEEDEDVEEEEEPIVIGEETDQVSVALPEDSDYAPSALLEPEEIPEQEEEEDEEDEEEEDDERTLEQFAPVQGVEDADPDQTQADEEFAEDAPVDDELVSEDVLEGELEQEQTSEFETVAGTGTVVGPIDAVADQAGDLAGEAQGQGDIAGEATAVGDLQGLQEAQAQGIGTQTQTTTRIENQFEEIQLQEQLVEEFPPAQGFGVGFQAPSRTRRPRVPDERDQRSAGFVEEAETDPDAIEGELTSGFLNEFTAQLAGVDRSAPDEDELEEIAAGRVTNEALPTEGELEQSEEFGEAAGFLGGEGTGFEDFSSGFEFDFGFGSSDSDDGGGFNLL